MKRSSGWRCEGRRPLQFQRSLARSAAFKTTNRPGSAVDRVRSRSTRACWSATARREMDVVVGARPGQPVSSIRLVRMISRSPALVETVEGRKPFRLTSKRTR